MLPGVEIGGVPPAPAENCASGGPANARVEMKAQATSDATAAGRAIRRANAGLAEDDVCCSDCDKSPSPATSGLLLSAPDLGQALHNCLARNTTECSPRCQARAVICVTFQSRCKATSRKCEHISPKHRQARSNRRLKRLTRPAYAPESGGQQVKLGAVGGARLGLHVARSCEFALEAGE
jgi:hypothetical protein